MDDVSKSATDSDNPGCPSDKSKAVDQIISEVEIKLESDAEDICNGNKKNEEHSKVQNDSVEPTEAERDIEPIGIPSDDQSVMNIDMSDIIVIPESPEQSTNGNTAEEMEYR